MKSESKKKWFSASNCIIIGTAVLFVIAVIFNVNSGKETKKVANTPQAAYTENTGEVEAVKNAGSSYFSAFRENRESTREKEIEYLNEIISAEASDDETIKEASAQKMDIVAKMEVEFAIEELIKAKGFTDVVVSFHEGSVNVIVEAAELDSAEVAKILDIVIRESKESPENVKVSTAVTNR